MMKLQFEPDLDFQRQAVYAVCDPFGGQEVRRTEFTVTLDRANPRAWLTFAENDLGTIDNTISRCAAPEHAEAPVPFLEQGFKRPIAFFRNHQRR